MRITKEVSVGNSVSIGANSVVLLGGKLNDHLTLASLSLNLRDEELPARTQWHGSPVMAATL
jgi:acetyltransferase-like isoleucine patch superfamily enzyme